jgi:hypothetical protein
MGSENVDWIISSGDQKHMVRPNSMSHVVFSDLRHSLTGWQDVSIETLNHCVKHAETEKSRKLRKHNTKVILHREHVFNITSEKLSDNEYLLLSKGLKFIPTPFIKNSKNYLMRVFDEFARKPKCKFLFQKTAEDSKIHPFHTNSGFDPQNHVEPIQTYIDKTRLELSSIQILNIIVLQLNHKFKVIGTKQGARVS